MAVGDVIAVISPTAWQSYVPALGVEIVITSVFSTLVGLSDGTIESTANTAGTGTPIRNDKNTKIMINNSVYLRYYTAVATLSAFTGLQIK